MKRRAASGSGLPVRANGLAPAQDGSQYRVMDSASPANSVLEGSPFAISVVDVRTPLRCASTIPAFTSRVNPKSSALMISRFKLRRSAAEWSRTSSDWLGSLQSVMQLAHGAVGFVIELRIHEQLADRALAGVHLVDGRVDSSSEAESWLAILSLVRNCPAFLFPAFRLFSIVLS